MFNLFLTQGSGILGPVERLLGWILNLIYEFLTVFGIENVGLTIIVFTFIVKTLMLPLTIRQQKFSKLSSIMNPEIVEIQNKYKDKKDEESMAKQQTELQAVYDKYGTNPTSGCLPMLITLPIMFALYRVIYKIPAYIEPIKELYTKIAEALAPIEGAAAKLVEYAGEVSVSVSDFSEYSSEGTLTLNHVIDILSKFGTEHWKSLASDFPNIGSTIESYSSEILRVNSIPGGINMLEAPGFTFPGIIIPILAALLQYIQTRQTAVTNNTQSNDPSMSTMNTMNKVMPIMSGIMCTMLPTGVGLYWVSNSLFTILQQIGINRYMKTADMDKLIEKQKEKQKEKEKSIGINQGESFENISRLSTKSINDDNIYRATDKNSNLNMPKDNSEDNKKDKDNNTSYEAGSISDYANILKKDTHNK